MPQYMIAGYQPDDFDPSTVTKEMMEEIHALNREMIAAGARKFACGITPARSAKSFRVQPDGKLLITDGPFTETKEHMGRLLDSGSRGHGGGPRVGAQGRRGLPLRG